LPFLAKLESELKSVQLHYDGRFEEQSKDLLILQEMVISTIDSIEEMRRRSDNLLLGKIRTEFLLV
jgi:hypothetical protein